MSKPKPAATQMTQGVIAGDSLELLDPALVSPGLLALAGDDAPTRTILCAGAGHFARANITLTTGSQIGSGPDADARIVARFDEISDRTGEMVPAYGLLQSERELASAGLNRPAAAVER